MILNHNPNSSVWQEERTIEYACTSGKHVAINNQTLDTIKVKI